MNEYHNMPFRLYFINIHTETLNRSAGSVNIYTHGYLYLINTQNGNSVVLFVQKTTILGHVNICTITPCVVISLRLRMLFEEPYYTLIR